MGGPPARRRVARQAASGEVGEINRRRERRQDRSGPQAVSYRVGKLYS